MEEKVIQNPFESSDYANYLSELKELRAEGEDKVRNLRIENRDIKLNKQIDGDTKKAIIDKNNEEIKKAKEVHKSHKEEIGKIVAEASKKASLEGKEYYSKNKEVAKEILDEATAKRAERKAQLKASYKETMQKINADYKAKLSTITDEKEKKGLKDEYKVAVKTEKIAYRSELLEIKNDYEDALQKAKDTKNDAFLEKYNMLSKIRNSRHTILEKIENYFKQYAYTFRFKDFMLKNALYFIIILFFIVVLIVGQAQGKNLFTSSHLTGILGQSSQKVFYSLGVAGLILLGGTDLSVGRLTGVGASFVCMLLANTTYPATNGIFTLDITMMPWGIRVIFAVLLSMIVCTIFTSIAGFFTAKFKMHPFITTLSTQLISYGLMMVLYSEYPAFNMNTSIKRTLVGGASYTNLIIMAVVTILIVWFIWNKTKFGKNMYAVGGNSEAASVSGISVFWTTMGVFIMAGILYGLGGFATAIQVGTANPGTGYGTELDAIAACVVGGISFSGGVGKISGAVVGTIIFTSMTYCLNFIGLDINFQYIFKGIIIMTAVCLDSLKYLKKK